MGEFIAIKTCTLLNSHLVLIYELTVTCSVHIITTPTILDVEASGFGSDSFPIEIGVKRADGERFCRLIKPYPSWRHWNEEAESLHGITRAQLEKYGQDGFEVCKQLNVFMGKQTAYSDGWVVDYPWLIKLYAEAGVLMTFKLSALEYILSEAQMKHWHATKQSLVDAQSVSRHRASVDAELIQQTYITTASFQVPASR